MSRLDGLPVLTAAEMRAAEAAAVAAGDSVAALMDRAGSGVATWAARLAGGAPILILCGPGNNGGDGYVAARVLAEGGADVRVAALTEPRTEAAQAAATEWTGTTTTLAEAAVAPVLVDALFGTGTVRPIAEADHIAALSDRARLRIAVDLPSGLDADRATAADFTPPADVTLALGALKPAHLLQPGATCCGEVRVIDLGLEAHLDSAAKVAPALQIAAPDATSHKYNRGRVTVVAGAMPGASLLCATAALRSGAGYVSLDGGVPTAAPAALVHRAYDAAVLSTQSSGSLVIGPGSAAMKPPGRSSPPRSSRPHGSSSMATPCDCSTPNSSHGTPS